MSILAITLVNYLISNDWILVIATILAFLIIFVGLHYIFYKKIKREDFDEHDIIGNYFNIAIIFYAVLLGFIVITAWQHYQENVANTQSEINSLTGIYEISNHFSTDEKEKIKQEIVRYINLMINVEWPAMQRGEDSPRAAYICVNDMLKSIINIPMSSKIDSNLQAEVLNLYDTFIDARRSRLYEIVEPYPTILILTLYIGAFLTIPLSIFIHSKHKKRQLLLTGVISGFVSILLCTFMLYQSPYQGIVAVPVTPWEKLLSEIHKLYLTQENEV